jgi:protein-tyrosine-phosphatase
MAMALFKNKVENDPLDWRIESAGTWANEGLPASNNSQQTLNDYGIDLSNHASRSVERISLNDYDLILVMEQGHKEALKVEYRSISDRVYLLYEMIGLIRDVHDPYGGRLVDYSDTADEINKILTEGLDKIKEIAQENEKVRLTVK